MKVQIKDNILFIEQNDLPLYKKGGSIVRNSYFWALKSIACHATKNSDWEFDEEVWVALTRMLTCFSLSGYLGTQETVLEFPIDAQIPDVLRPVSTWL